MVTTRRSAKLNGENTPVKASNTKESTEINKVQSQEKKKSNPKAQNKKQNAKYVDTNSNKDALVPSTPTNDDVNKVIENKTIETTRDIEEDVIQLPESDEDETHEFTEAVEPRDVLEMQDSIEVKVLDNDAISIQDNSNTGVEDEKTNDVIDIMSYAKLAATGLFKKKSNPKSDNNSTATNRASDLLNEMVPDILDSGINQQSIYFTFQGTKAHRKPVELNKLATKVLEDTHEAKINKQSQHKQQQKLESVITNPKKTTSNMLSAGAKWFGMRSEKVTPDIERDLAMIRMRNYLDPKKFYKSSDHSAKKIPKVVQRGTVIEGAHEFKSARMVNKDRRQTFAEEIMADANVQQYTKRVYNQIAESRVGRGKNARKRMKKSR